MRSPWPPLEAPAGTSGVARRAFAILAMACGACGDPTISDAKSVGGVGGEGPPEPAAPPRLHRAHLGLTSRFRTPDPARLRRAPRRDSSGSRLTSRPVRRRPSRPSAFPLTSSFWSTSPVRCNWPLRRAVPASGWRSEMLSRPSSGIRGRPALESACSSSQSHVRNARRMVSARQGRRAPSQSHAVGCRARTP
jgi:hypothetical protein